MGGFRCYIAHLWAEKKNLDAVLADSEQLLRQTYGYTSMRNDPQQRQKADALLDATQRYARKLADMPEGIAELADSTGFSPEGVLAAMSGIRSLESKLTVSDWAPESLFGSGGRMADLFGVMLRVPQLSQDLVELGGKGFDRSRISEITNDWVNGKGLEAIAREYFSREKDDDAGYRRAHRCLQGDLSYHRQQRNMGCFGSHPSVGDRFRYAFRSG